MKEVWLTKWVPFHLIFFKGVNWLILPCISFRTKSQSMGSEIVFGFLKWRMSIYFHNGN